MKQVSSIQRELKTYFILLMFFGFGSATFSQTTYTFTHCGATGQFGPSQALVNTAYASTNLSGNVVSTAGIQSWTVPTSGTYSVTAYGARGTSGGAYTGGSGARMSGTFSFTAGNVLKIAVGQMGLSDGCSGGGGGGSFVVSSANVPYLIAAGGGGIRTASSHNGCAGNTSTLAGTASGSSASWGCGLKATGAGLGGIVSSGSYGAGGGGFNGVGATDYNTGGGSWATGVIGGNGVAQGGFGGGGSGNGGCGGGGGGGYSGGDGGHIAGGGGSYNTGTNQSNAPGVNSGNGYVVITRLAGVNIVQTTSVTCNGALTGVLTASASGGTAPYTYTWLPGSSNNATLSGVGAGNYTCMSTDASAAVYTTTFFVSEPTPVAANVTGVTNNICNGGAAGSATVVASGGTPGYTYSWSPSGGTGAVGIGLTAGNFTCTIKDLNNCTITRTASITQPAPINVVAFATNPVVCLGQTSTLIGAGAVTYTWTNGVSNGVAFSPAATASYVVSGTDGNGCIGTAFTTITVNPLPVISVTGSSAICIGASTSFTASGANTYTWSNSTIGSVVAVSPTTTTVYSVTGTSTLGCNNTIVKTLIINTLPNVVALATNSTICVGSPLVLYGNGANTYTWSSGVINGLAFTPTATAGYTVTGTDVNGCVNSSSTSVTVNALPVLSVSGSTGVCTGASATFSVTGANTYTWTTGSNQSTITVTPVSSTVYMVYGTNASGCVNFATQPLVVYGPPVITANGTTNAVCDGVPVTLFANGAATYTWQPGNLVNQFVTVTPNVTTIYTVTGTSVNGCINSGTQTVTINSAPPITVSGPTAVCSGNSITLTASGAISYTWNTGAVSASIVVSPTTATAYSVLATGSNGCKGSKINAIIVESLPNVTASANAPVICNGTSATLIGNGAATYTWLPMNLSGQIVTVSPSSNSSYTLYGTSSNGCSNSTSVTVGVNALPSVSITSTNASICIGSSTNLNANGALSYTWSTGATGSGITISPSSTTSYTVSGTGSNGCNNTAVQSITVNTLPTITINSSNSLICADETVSLTASGASTYVWSTLASGSVVAITPSVTANYTVTGTDQNGCSNTHVYLQMVSPCTGIESMTNPENLVSIYPNPNNGEFKISSDFDLELTLINDLGQVVKTQHLRADNQREISITDLSNGIYFVFGQYKDQVIKQKIIVTK